MNAAQTLTERINSNVFYFEEKLFSFGTLGKIIYTKFYNFTK